MRIAFPLALISTTALFVAGLHYLDSKRSYQTKFGNVSKVENVSIAAVDPDLSKLSKYKNWTLVNPEPVLMDAQTAAMCASVRLMISNPHSSKYISVFINSEAHDSMLTKLDPSFPVGSMIVKEKLNTKDSKAPELLTAMIKHEKGYYPEGGDWEYLVLDGAASKIVERGKLDKCNSCHTMYKTHDFVTRTYLPDNVRNALR